jgi:hypothetical protein
VAGSNKTNQVITNPTYLGDIRYFFTQDDIDHMGQKGIDLSTYDGVKKNALRIYAITGPTGSMPPGKPWSADQHQTFKNWILTGYPMGSATVATAALAAKAAPTRLRKNITTLSGDELAALAKAFQGLMARDPTDPNSYFGLASIHGLPQSWCSHHIDAFNPWHRVYLDKFEAQLRTIPGCEDVTLPYWDITTPIPNVLNQPPFDKYVLPLDPGATATPPQRGYFPLTTSRYDWATIEFNLSKKGYSVLDDLNRSLVQSTWGEYNQGGFQDFFDQGHDGGHVSIGPTMADQNIASFDPIFWFFHCNLDRLWLYWQVKLNATTLNGFKSTISPGSDTSWLEAPFNQMQPFTETTVDGIINFASYDDLTGAAEMENKLGSVPASRKFSIKRAAPVSVRVKGIDRMSIPGSFVVNLLADGKPISKRAFFQPNIPRNCPNCKKKALVNIDFRIDPDQILDKALSVSIEVPNQQHMGPSFPLSEAGDPTVNVRLLIDEE